MRKLALVVAAAAILTPSLAFAAEKEIYGTYKLVSITQRFETGEVAT
jgi:hypothetical protein